MSTSTTLLPRWTLEEAASRIGDGHPEHVAAVRASLARVIETFAPRCLVVHECQLLDSSRAGELTALPVGGTATLREVPSGAWSPRGLASDMGVSVAVVEVPA